jgi:hypothetical protein
LPGEIVANRKNTRERRRLRRKKVIGEKEIDGVRKWEEEKRDRQGGSAGAAK